MQHQNISTHVQKLHTVPSQPFVANNTRLRPAEKLITDYNYKFGPAKNFKYELQYKIGPVLEMGIGLHRWKRTPTVSGRKLEQLNTSAKRARTDSKADHAGLLACVDGLVAEAGILFKGGTTTTIVKDGDQCL